MLEEYTMKLQTNKAQLSASVASQVDAARSGLELLDSAQKTLKNLQHCYQVIDKLCMECSSLIEHHEKIQVLSAVHYNLGKTLQDVENIAALPNEAAEAEELLCDDTNLLQAFESLAILEGTSSMAQRALQNNSKLRLEDSRNLSTYFNKVRETLGKFEERLWSLIRNFIVLGRDNPGMLVNAVRIIELQELVDKQLEASGHGAVKPKRYRKRCEQQIGMCIQDTFAPLLRNCAQLAAAGENTDKRTNEILDKAHEFVVQLADIYDFVSPCFPEKYAIFRVIFAEYHQHLAFMLDCIGACAQQLANSDILKIMGWISGYQETLGDLGIEEDEAHFPQGGSRGTTLLIDKYIERMRAMLHAWFVNILEADLNSAPKQADDGRLWTPGAVDFFRIVNEQVAVVEDVSSADMLLRTGEAILQIMREFQEAQQRHLQRDLSDALLCAGKLDIEAQCRGFLVLAKSAVAHLVGTIFGDSALAELFQKLYCSEDWQQGTVTGSILATLSDYFDDFKQLLEPTFFKRLVDLCLEEGVAHFVAALVTYAQNITDASLEAIQRDHDEISKFFEAFCSKERVVKSTQALEDLKELAASDSVDTFVLSYTSLLQVAPGITPTLLERIVAARTDLTKADIKEVMEHVTCPIVGRPGSLQLMDAPTSRMQRHSSGRRGPPP
ncbi:hypothetical protein WJX81_003676 [Elliptochloris bilobata]|uniref:Exocyst complex component Sec6 n=1 Tax=Elliptochloris bilobata TaxID=381761 RepID=A0AAW1R1B9_9CHLO